MDSIQLFERYAEMQSLTRRMQEYARTEQWDGLIELERIRASITDELMKYENDVLWIGSDIGRKNELIRSILEMDGEIKSLTQGWKSELQEILGSIDNEKKLNKAYKTP